MRKLTIAAAALIASAISAHATTITPAAGLDLTRGTTEANALQVFSEQSGVAVTSDDSVNIDYLVGTNLSIGGAGTGFHNAPVGETLTAGTYDSFLVHYDPTSANSISNVLVDFGQTIVGIILSNNSAVGSAQFLNMSDAMFGTASAYDTHVGRRAEDNDTFTLTSATSLTFSLGTNATHIDNIRVLTQPTVAAVPLPASLPLLLAGFGALGIARRRRG